MTPGLGYVDTHCHLDSIMQRLHAATYADFATRHLTPACEACLTVSCDPQSIEPTLALVREAQVHPIPVFAAFGIHPHDSRHWTENLAQALDLALKHERCVAYGEIGLDYHYDFSPREVQREVFRQQVRLGIASGKPLVIHTREAEADTLGLMRDEVPKDYPVHVHCFTSSAPFAEALLAHFSRLYLGFTGIITFKNAGEIETVARMTPLTRMLLETDGPYLAPAPHRGQVAHPGHIPLIAQKLAALKNLPLAELYAVMRQNTRDIYGI